MELAIAIVIWTHLVLLSREPFVPHSLQSSGNSQSLRSTIAGPFSLPLVVLSWSHPLESPDLLLGRLWGCVPCEGMGHTMRWVTMRGCAVVCVKWGVCCVRGWRWHYVQGCKYWVIMAERFLTCNECCCKKLGRVKLTTISSEKCLEVCISREIDARECDVS